MADLKSVDLGASQEARSEVRARIWGERAWRGGRGNRTSLEACKPSYFSFCGGEEVGEFEKGSAETKDTLPRVFPPSGRHSYSGHNSTIVVVMRPSDPVLFFLSEKQRNRGLWVFISSYWEQKRQCGVGAR